MGLRLKGKPADALWFGTGIHLALAEWYIPGVKRGVHPIDTWLDFCEEEETKIRTAITEDFNEDVWVDAKDLGVAMLEGYLKKYGADEEWDVIAPEQTFEIEIPFRTKEGIMAKYCGTFDLVFRDLKTDEIWLGENKTAKIISTTHLQLDDQAGSYWAVASKILQAKGVLRKGESIEGIMYNFLRKGLPDDRPEDEKGRKLNKDGSVSKNQPKPLFLREAVFRTRAERAQQLRRIQNEAAWMGLARKNPDILTKNPTRDCSWDCSFFDMCQLHENGSDDWVDFADSVYVQRDPYADHRKSTSD